MNGLNRNEEECPLCRMMEEVHGIRPAVPYDEIVRTGLSLPPAETMSDEQVSRKLDRLISALAGMHICLVSTDHLSDRELYTLLCDDLLREVMDIFPPDQPGATTIDLIGGGSEGDIELYLTYYADDETRELWRQDFPEDSIPDKKPLPYDRDRFLPTLEMLVAETGDH